MDINTIVAFASMLLLTLPINNVVEFSLYSFDCSTYVSLCVFKWCFKCTNCVFNSMLYCP